MLDQALAYAQAHRPEALEALKQFIRIPSISTLPEHKIDMQQAAGWLVEKMTAIGLEHATAYPTAGHPVVYADWLHAGPAAPTVLVYGHYDVQPVDPLEEWQTPPFEPTLQGDKLYARGASDDKGQLYVHLASVEAYLKTAGRLPVNLKFMIEGEEESGSVNLEQFVQEHGDLLQTDLVLISDTHILDPQTPVIITGVRGLAYMEISLRGSERDLHSGIYGGVVENPLNAMVRLLASLHDEQGRVNIPGFYDDVLPLTPAERAAINVGPVTDESLKAETGVPALWTGETGYTSAERRGARPTLDVHGIKGGFTGVGAKTVIPAVATAKVSMRLVPNQDPYKITQLFINHVERLAPPTMVAKAQTIHLGDGAVVTIDSPAIEAAAVAYEQVFGQRPLYLREGGSIPVVALFSKKFKVPVVLMGFGLPDDALHAPNERFHLPNFYRGIETAIRYYDLVAYQNGAQAAA
ncbi:MAG TPA: dipeptidase [Anaerolineae bacterium]|nr:dipeptidase [Anaerolineae bacterium]